MKRLFDIVMSLIGLLLCSPLLLIVAVIVRLDSPGTALFRQKRVGRNFRTFQLLKFRTMATDATGAAITSENDCRITRAGAVLRKFKLDELPQLFNVLRGDMSFVGPRPELPEFVEEFRHGYADLLTVRPGITDPASLKYRSESEILGGVSDPIRYYREVILPDKIAISRGYISHSSIRSDLFVILDTIASAIVPDR